MPDSRVGVCLYVPPMLRGYPLQSQGLTRHAVTTTAALVRARPCTVTIVTPRWVRAETEEMIRALAPEHSDRIIVRSPRVPAPSELLATAVVRWRARERGRARSPRRLASSARGMVIATLSSWTGMLAALVAIVAASIGIAVVLAVLVGWPLLLMLSLLAALGVLAAPSLARLGRRRGVCSRVRRLGARVWRLIRLRQAWVSILEPADVASLVRTANRTGVRVWWMPVALYAELARLKGAKIATFADFVPAEFPTMLVDQPALVVRGRAMSTCLSASDAIICLSDHVRTRHLPTLVAQPTAVVTVIPPGPPVRAESLAPIGSAWSVRAALVASLAREFPRSVARSPSWWSEPVLIAPTQDRPYKNVRGLIQAVRILNIEHRVRARLILTADPRMGGLGDYVALHGCRAFVEFLPRMSDQDLNRALACADLAVTPSLFEGSLPYTLFESVSVGTPCLMADIPVTREATQAFEAFRDVTLVDATSPPAMAERIRRSLPMVGELHAVQRAFVDEYYREAGWDVVAIRYWEVVDLLGSHG